MTKKRKRSSGRFALGMLIYALTFVVFLSIGLRLFWSYIDNFEKAQPSHAIDRYITSFDSSHIRAISSDFVSSLDHTIQSEEESYRLIEDLFDDSLRYAKNSAESTEDRLVYAIISDDRTLGTMVLNRAESNGDTVWSVSDERFDFSELLNSDEIVVPEDWTVSCNGNVLGEQYVVERGICYPSMQEAYDYGFDLPKLTRYAISNYIGTVTFELHDAEGNEAFAENDPSDYKLTGNCSAEQTARMDDFARRLLPLYIAFMSNTNHNAYDNYIRVYPYLLPGSDLANRFYNAIAGQTWSHSQGDVLHDVVVNCVYEVADGEYMIDVDYKVDTTGSGITTENDAGMLIVAVDQGTDGIFATELFIK